MSRLIVFAALFAIACTPSSKARKPDPTPGAGGPANEARSTDRDDHEQTRRSAAVMYPEPVAITTEKVRFTSGEATLRGEVVRPEKIDSPRPGVLIVHDWGPHNREGLMAETFGVRLPVEVPVYRTLAEGLASRGAVVLIYDKRTCVKGGPPWCEYPRSYVEAREDLASALVEDVVAAAKVLGDRDDVASLHLLGHGHGSELAAVAAAKVDTDSVAMLAPTPYALDEIVQFQTAKSIELLREELERIGDKPTADPLKRQLKELRKQQDEQEKAFEALRGGAMPESDVFGLAPKSWADVLAVHDAYLERLRKLDVPVLALVGDVDPGLPEDSNQRMEAIVRPHGDHAFALVTDLTRFGVGVGEEDDPTTVSPIVVEALIDFLDSGAR